MKTKTHCNYEYAWKIKRNHFLAIIIFHIFFSTFVTIFRLTKIKCMRKSVFHENYTRFFFFVYRLVLFSSMRIDWLNHFYALIAMCAFNFVLSVQISTFKLLGRFNILFLMFAFIVLLPSFKPLAFTILFFGSFVFFLACNNNSDKRNFQEKLKSCFAVLSIRMEYPDIDISFANYYRTTYGRGMHSISETIEWNRACEWENKSRICTISTGPMCCWPRFSISLFAFHVVW